jgi:hypothetical protein
MLINENSSRLLNCSVRRLVKRVRDSAAMSPGSATRPTHPRFPAPRIDQFNQAYKSEPQRGQAVFHGGGHGTFDMAIDQAAVFHFSQRLDQHLLGNTGQAAHQHAVSRGAPMPGMQCVQDHAGPFGGKDFHRAAGGAVFAPIRIIAAGLHHGYLSVAMSQFGAVWHGRRPLTRCLFAQRHRRAS